MSLSADETELQRSTGTKNYAVLISTMSLLVAAASAVFAYTASRDAYVSDRRSELIGYLQQLNGLESEAGLQEEEVQTLVAQAAWIIRSVPDVPPSVYRQLGEALVNETAYDEDALPLLDQAIELAALTGDEVEQVAAHRVKANIYERFSDPEAMRREYEAAAALSESYAGPSNERRHSVPAFTHVNWGYAEVRMGACDEAAQQLALARQHAESFTAFNLDEAIRLLQGEVDACVETGTVGLGG